MSDLLIRNIDPHLKKQLEESARAHRRSLSEEVRHLLKRALLARPAEEAKIGLGTAMMNLVRPEDRGDDLVFEVAGAVREPPDFE